MSNKPPHRESIVLGMAAATAAMFSFTVMNTLAKYLSVRHSVIDIAFYRNLVGCLPFLALVFVFGRRDVLRLRSKPQLVIARAVFGVISLTTTFAAFSLMPMAETAALLFTASLYAPVLGVLLLKERVGPYRWAAVVIGFVGVAVMVNPQGDFNTLGVILALGAALLQATMGIVLRHLRGWESPETISFYFFMIGLAITATLMPFVAVAPTWKEAPLLIGVGLSGALAQWCLTVAYRHAPAAIVAVFNYTNLVWALLFGWLIWHDWPATIVLTGAAIVIAANVLIVWRESRLARLPVAANDTE
jgi:drug/metabolite transporter (DMT)-like permease